MSETTSTLTSIDVLHDNNPYLYISRGEVENFTVNSETQEGHFVFHGYWHIAEERLPTNLEFFLYEGSQATHYKVEVQKKVQLEEVEQEGFEDDECPGCRIVLFPEYIFQVFFKVLETNPVTQKLTTETETTPITQETKQEESDDLVSKILQDMGTN